jgi:ABC-type branched-subunit amino acid transport system substrate-binding protein
VQAAVLAAVVVVVAGAAYGIVAGTSSKSTPPAHVAAGLAPSGVGVDQASTSSRGVSATSINVVFPISNLTSLASNFGFAGDAEFAQQPTAIDTFVNAINDAGGINGRKINPIIVNFDPTNEASMRSQCKQWTEGSPPVFAVIDGLGDWTGDDELCIAQEGHTPFIGEWTTVSSWTQAASPYLWWTGPDETQVLATLVQWAKGAGLIGGHRKLGIVVGDRTSDQSALDSYVIPDLRAAGITHEVVETLPSDVSDSAATNATAPLVVQRFESDGVDSVIPLVPFNAFFPYLGAENSQHYFPKLLLSDYESTVSESLGLIPVPYEQALNDQEGITTETLGGTDAPTSLVGTGGYDPGVENCYKIWHAANPNPISGQTLIHGEAASPYIEEQGPIAGWCEAVELFAAAAKKAGADLNRRSFVEAMANIKDFSGTFSPTLSFGPDKFAGPTQYQVVELHNNVPPSKLCPLTYQKITQGTCWHVLKSWKPLASG